MLCAYQHIDRNTHSNHLNQRLSPCPTLKPTLGPMSSFLFCPPVQITTIADDIAELQRGDLPAVASARALGDADAAAELAESLSTAENGVRALIHHADAAAATLVRRRALQVEAVGGR